MIRTTPELRTAAERLLKLEAAGSRGTRTQPTVARVGERFRRILSTLLGTAGFHALLARAVTLAKAEVPALNALQIQADSSLVGLSEDDDSVDGEVVLVAHILGLLVTFVGEALMLRFVNDAWPKVRLDDLDFDKDEP
jgi:hypothetical protein